MALRPHLKTAKSVDVARRVMTSPAGPATVSTLAKPSSSRRPACATSSTPSASRRPSCRRCSRCAPRAPTLRGAGHRGAGASRRPGLTLRHAHPGADRNRLRRPPLRRAADRPQRLLEIGRALDDGAQLRGVLTHAGDSYSARGAEALRQCAEAERRSVVDAAAILREAGLACPVVSVGSTPTAHTVADLTGVTEVRAGVFVFIDLVMAGIGVCQVDDIAVSVLATVDRPPAREGMDPRRRGLDGAVAGPRHAQAGGRPGLRAGLRRRRHPVCRPDRCRREPGARDHRACAPARAARFPIWRSAIVCASCRTTPAPPAPSIAAITSCAGAPTRSKPSGRVSGAGNDRRA